MQGGLALQHFNVGAYKKLELLLPSLSEQRSIVDLLAAWNTAIEKTEQLIAAKQRRNEFLSNRLLFGHARFRQRNTKTTRALHWFSAPSDWQVVEIGKVAHEVSALNSNDDGLPVLSCTKYDGLVDSLKYFDKQVFSHDTSKYKMVRRGQFAYATNHIEEGSIGYQDLVPAGLVSPIYTVFQADAEKIDDGYFYKLLKTEKMRQIFAAQTNASVDRRGSLRWKEFARIHIPLPPLDEQQEISAVLDEAKREVALLQTQQEALKTQKRGLMQKLLSGQWRVPSPPAPLPLGEQPCCESSGFWVPGRIIFEHRIHDGE
jgi:type I restriction enzyme S subunit